MPNTDLSKFNVFGAIADKIVSMIETAPDTYRAPWHGAGKCFLPRNAFTDANYQGVNVLSLWIEAQRKGFTEPVWASFRQWQKLGAHVRWRERGTLVVFYKRMETLAAESTNEDTVSRTHFVARASHVFNVAQVDGFVSAPMPELTGFEQLAQLESFVDEIKVKVAHGFNHACYRPDTDSIEMPSRERFWANEKSTAEENYYAVLLHEITHWTGAEHRLNRDLGKRFGDAAYAFEELVAEIGAAFLCAAFGVSTEPRADHAVYVKNWLGLLKDDPRALFTAARGAQEAFEYLASLAMENSEPKPVVDATM